MKFLLNLFTPHKPKPDLRKAYEAAMSARDSLPLYGTRRADMNPTVRERLHDILRSKNG